MSHIIVIVIGDSIELLSESFAGLRYNIEKLKLGFH
jgi:hypothetical protein